MQSKGHIETESLQHKGDATNTYYFPWCTMPLESQYPVGYTTVTLASKSKFLIFNNRSIFKIAACFQQFLRSLKCSIHIGYIIYIKRIKKKLNWKQKNTTFQHLALLASTHLPKRSPGSRTSARKSSKCKGQRWKRRWSSKIKPPSFDSTWRSRSLK